MSQQHHQTRRKSLRVGESVRQALRLASALGLSGLALFLSLVAVGDLASRVVGSERPQWASIILVVCLIGVIVPIMRRSFGAWRDHGGVRLASATPGSSRPTQAGSSAVVVRLALAGSLLVVGGFVAGAVARVHRRIPATHLRAASGLSRPVFDILDGVAWTLLILGVALVIVGVGRYWVSQASQGREKPTNADEARR
jgi:hypothetical protein